MKTNDKLHILANGSVRIAANVDESASPEEAKSAGDNGEDAEAAPGQAREQEGAEGCCQTYANQSLAKAVVIGL